MNGNTLARVVKAFLRQAYIVRLQGDVRRLRFHQESTLRTNWPRRWVMTNPPLASEDHWTRLDAV